MTILLAVTVIAMTALLVVWLVAFVVEARKDDYWRKEAQRRD